MSTGHAPAGIADPTGAGDAFRPGFLAGTAWGWTQTRAARLGCAMATTVLESVGTQEYELTSPDLIARIERAYGIGAARAAEPRLARVS